MSEERRIPAAGDPFTAAELGETPHVLAVAQPGSGKRNAIFVVPPRSCEGDAALTGQVLDALYRKAMEPEQLTIFDYLGPLDGGAVDAGPGGDKTRYLPCPWWEVGA